MNETITKLLSVQVAISGLSRAQSGILALAQGFGATSSRLETLATDLTAASARMAPLIALMSGQLATGGKWQTAEIRLEAFTHSASKAHEQMQFIESIAAKGLFKFDDITKAIDRLDQMNINLRDTWDLVEKLGARSGNLPGAADLVASIAGARGSVPRLVNRLRPMGITPEMMAQQGLNVHGSTISDSPGKILEVLKKIESMDPILNKLEGTLGVAFGSLLFNITKILQMTSGPLVTAMTMLLTPVNEVLQAIIGINEATHGLLGGLLGIVALVSAFEKIAVTWKLISGYIKLSAIWQGFLNAAQKAGLVIAALYNTVITIYEILADRIAFAAAWQLILDILMENWKVVAAAAVAAAAMGIGWHTSHQDHSPGGPAPADRPNRRDDIENVYKKAYGRAWTG